jgi:hypothetical protein
MEIEGRAMVGVPRIYWQEVWEGIK